MTPHRKATSVIALFLVATVSLFYVQTTLAGPVTGAKSATVSGKLITSGDQPILLNGNQASTGATVLSGTQITTSEKSSASVQLGALGSLDIAANTDLNVVFNEKSVAVSLNSGYVTLTTNEGVSGTITTSEGATVKTDPTTRSSVIGKTSNSARPVLQTEENIGYEGMPGGLAFGLVVLTAAVVAAILISHRGRGANPSPARP